MQILHTITSESVTDATFLVMDVRQASNLQYETAPSLHSSYRVQQPIKRRAKITGLAQVTNCS